MPPLTLFIYLLHVDPDDSPIFAHAYLPSCFLSLCINTFFFCHRFSLTHYSINSLQLLKVLLRLSVCFSFVMNIQVCYLHISIASNMTIIDDLFSGTSRPVVILVGGVICFDGTAKWSNGMSLTA